MTSGPNNPIASLDVGRLLQEGVAQGTRPSFVPLLVAVIVLTTLVTIGGNSPVVQALMPVVLAGMILFSFMRASRMAKQQRMEQGILQEIDETIRLGRWDVAGWRLMQVLSAPVQRPHARFQSLIYLGTVLTHEGRFEDVERVYDYLLQNAQLPPQIAFSVRCARAYAILREDRLTDAYETLAGLRRDPMATDSAMLQLLEMYRLVKTGHNDDAMALFEQRQALFAAQLGHRSADAWALAAKAAEGLGRPEQSASYARNALMLGRQVEMVLRFPECAGVLQRAATGGKSGIEGGGL